MNKVFIVISEYYEEYTVEKVFNDRDAAEAYADSLYRGCDHALDLVYIKECEVE